MATAYEQAVIDADALRTTAESSVTTAGQAASIAARRTALLAAAPAYDLEIDGRRTAVGLAKAASVGTNIPARASHDIMEANRQLALAESSRALCDLWLRDDTLKIELDAANKSKATEARKTAATIARTAKGL